MNHLSDFQLNEYLDHILDESTRRALELHLEACPDCSARLQELQLVSVHLANLHEAQLSHDLTKSVIAHLPQEQPRTWTLFFAAQLGAALGALLFISLELAQAVHLPPASTFRSLIPEIRFSIPSFQLSTLYSLFAIIHPFSPFPSSLFYLPQLPTFQFPFSNGQIFVIALFTLLLGFTGNAILLREHSEVQK
jgi:Putative zinc-finger